MEVNSPAPLREVWYYAVAGQRLKPGRVLAKTMMGEPILLGRGKDGGVFAFRDLCPHRGIPLSCGWFDGEEVTCRFHGWRFDRSGACTAIPSLVAGQDFDPRRIKVKTYPVREVQGSVWIFFGENCEAAPEIPTMPDAGDRRPNLIMRRRVRSSIDQAVFGQMDPTHNPFVHTSWWWRKPHELRAKEKAFAPVPFGFTMVPHRPSTNLRLYNLLGSAPRTEIIFRLPSTRVEHLRFGRHYLVIMNSMTPVGEREVEMNYAAWWNFPLFTLLKPLLLWAGHIFSGQDCGIIEMQSRGLVHNPPLLLIDDADTQAKWYHRLKNEYIRSRAEGRPFVNPVKERVLRFRS
jgi:phenylpropionate dioxygenase-like ring-hydroxylating dioxygenase large terminal subunit